MAKFYVTTPIYYVNDVPHIGHAYTTIAADVLARYHRLKGDTVFFLTGTDEHGQKIEEAATKAGKTPKAFVDGVVPAFKEAWKLLDISHDQFIRTTDKQHESAVQALIKVVHDKGDIYLGDYEGKYCSGCEQFYLERELVEGKCPVHKKEVKTIKEPSYFFRLSNYQDKLLAHYRAHPGFIAPQFRQDEFINRVKEGLKDLSISRTSVAWGIPFPIGKGHVVYVWFDALTNYISALGWPDAKGDFKTFWPADAHLVGKEIAWFHCVIWPAMLMSAGIELPRQVYAHGWLTIEGQKMSKSLGNFITAKDLVARFGTDASRYFLLYNIPFGHDGDFSEAELVKHVNADLADAYGNLLSRVLTLVEKNFAGEWPAMGELTEHEQDIETAANALGPHVENALDALEFHKALDHIFTFVRLVNKYMTDTTPWKITDKKRLGTVLYTILESMRVATHYLTPFIPQTAAKAAAQLGQSVTSLEEAHFDHTTTGNVKKSEVLQKKLDVKKQEHPFAKLNLRVAHVLDVMPHPEADKLYVLKINVGIEERTLVAGLRAYYQPEELRGKHIIIVANMKPAKLRGVVSQGMLLAADKDGKVKVLEAKDAEPGAPVTIDGVRPGTGQVGIDDVVAAKLTTKLKRVVVDGQQLVTPLGHVEVDIDDGATIR